MKKQLTLAIAAFGITCTLFGAGFMHYYNSVHWNDLKPDSVVAYLYTYTCEKCGYENGEGDYSFSVSNGFEYCPECGYEKQFNTFEESALNHK